MAVLGAKKQFKGIGDKAQQFAIDAVLLTEVLSKVPRNIKIYGIKVSFSEFGKGNFVAVPNDLKKLGVNRIRVMASSRIVTIVFDEIKPDQIVGNVKKVCEKMGYDFKKVVVDNITLANSEASAYFQKTSKEIHPDETDQRKKLFVLGATSGEGRVSTLFADLNADKFVCEVQTIQVKTTICRKE